MNKDVTETGIKNLDKCDEEEFFAIGKTLARIEHGMQWAIGDWYNAIKWGDKEAACEKAGLEYKTAFTYGRIAAVFEFKTRVLNLSFKHHRVLAIESLTDSQRQKLLAQAVKNTWSSAAVKKERDKVLGIEPQTLAVPSLDEKIDAVLDGLPKTVSVKAKKDIHGVYTDLKKRFFVEVDQEVKARMKEARMGLVAYEKEIDGKREQTIKLMAGVRSFMDEQEYKLVLSCLHPDRECAPGRKNKAFIIFKRLEDTIPQYQ